MKYLLILFILLAVITITTSCNDDSPQQEDVKEEQGTTYVPNEGLHYKRISGINYDVRFYYDSKGRADSVIYSMDGSWDSHFQFHYNPNKVTAKRIYHPALYIPTITYDTIVPYYNGDGCIYRLEHTSYEKRENGGYVTLKEKVYMNYDDSIHLRNITANHHSLMMSAEGSIAEERNGTTICQLGWNDNNLYDITASREDYINYHSINTKIVTSVSHVFTYNDKSPDDFLNKYDSFTFNNTSFLYNIDIEYLRPFAFLGQLGKGPRMLPTYCSLITSKYYGDALYPSSRKDAFEEAYQYDTEGRVTSQYYRSVTYEY